MGAARVDVQGTGTGGGAGDRVIGASGNRVSGRSGEPAIANHLQFLDPRSVQISLITVISGKIWFSILAILAILAIPNQPDYAAPLSCSKVVELIQLAARHSGFAGLLQQVVELLLGVCD